VAALATSAFVHIDLAGSHDYPGTISGSVLFDAQGATAAAVALVLLVTGHRLAWGAAALVGIASFVAVMVSRYGTFGAIGPLPNMTDHTWQPSPEKPLSAVVEAALPVLAVAWFAFTRVGSRRAVGVPHPAGS
jgi:hypothetical protein